MTRADPWELDEKDGTRISVLIYRFRKTQPSLRNSAENRCTPAYAPEERRIQRDSCLALQIRVYAHITVPKTATHF